MVGSQPSPSPTQFTTVLMKLHSLNNSELQALGHSLCTKLPRELRDMIYSYICDTDTVKNLQLDRLLAPPVDSQHKTILRNSKTRHTTAVTNESLVGEQIPSEALE